jgi:hypothetical protein
MPAISNTQKAAGFLKIFIITKEQAKGKPADIAKYTAEGKKGSVCEYK